MKLSKTELELIARMEKSAVGATSVVCGGTVRNRSGDREFNAGLKLIEKGLATGERWGETDYTRRRNKHYSVLALTLTKKG